MNKTDALKIAREQIGQVHKIAAGRGGVTWGFNVLVGRQTRTVDVGTYARARAHRADMIAETVAELRGVEYRPAHESEY